MPAWLTPLLSRLITSPWWRASCQSVASLKRRVAGHRPTLLVFLRADDPYSTLLAIALAELHQRTHAHVRIETRLIEAEAPDMMADAGRAEPLARKDGNRLARLYGYDVRFNSAITPTRRQLAQALLIAIEGRVDALDLTVEILKALWSARDDALSAVGIDLPTATRISHRLRENEALLAKRGHYQSATVYFEGEWYWGIDRLMFLEQRLNAMQLCRRVHIHYDRTYQAFCQHTSAEQTKPPLEYFFSLRSPYSYVGFVKAQIFARHHGLQLALRPVLPMVMRGLSVPRRKAMQILFDACREARWWQVPFGTVADPLGAGVIRSYQVLEYAYTLGREEALISSLFKGVWAEGLRADTDRGLKRMVERAGLSWSEVRPWLTDTNWEARAAKNQSEINDMNYWGVPVLRLGEVSVWGQDRYWVIESALAKGTYRGR